MSEAAAGGGRAEAKRRIIQRSLEDDSFRQRLLEDPKAAVEQELGARLPEEVRLVAVEESPDTVYLVLPPSQAEGERGALSDQELETVAGREEAGCWLTESTGAVEDARHVRHSTRPSAHLPGRGHTQAGSTENERGSA